MRSRRNLAIGAALLSVMGCAEEFSSASLIRRNQIIAAQVSVVGDSERASPTLGETFQVELAVVDPKIPAPLTWGFIVCVPEDARFGISICDSDFDPLAVFLQTTPTTLRPSFSMELVEIPEGVDELLVLGAVCANGTLSPLFEEVSTDVCLGDMVEQNLTTFTVSIASGNRNPAIQEIQINGVPWTFDPDPETPIENCDQIADAISFNGREENVVVSVIPTAESRESYEVIEDDGGETTMALEDIDIAHLTTAGEFERLFSFLGEESDLEVEVEWTSPSEQPPPGGQLVRFHFVLRDGRGGSTATSRALCFLGG